MEIMCCTTLFGDCTCHDFTHQAYAEARLAAKRGRDSSTESLSSPVQPALMPLGPAHHSPDHAPSARQAARAMTSAPVDADSAPMLTSPTAPTSPLHLGPAHRISKASRAATSVTSPDETSAGVSATTWEPTQIADYSAPPAPVVRPFPPDRQRLTLPVSLPLPQFAFPGPDLTPAPAQPQGDVVVTQKYPSPPGSRLSTPLYDLAEFGSPNSNVTMSESLGVASVVYSHVLPAVARFMALNPQGSHESHLSSEQLSPNRVRSDFDVDSVALYPLFATSPRSDGALPLISPITSPESPLSPASSAAHFLLDEAPKSFANAGVSLATSMSITDRTAELQLMTPPLIPLPETRFRSRQTLPCSC